MNPKISKIINLVLILLVVVLAFMIPSKNKEQAETTAPTKTTLDIIHQRKSVRHFEPCEMSKEQMATLVRAGMAAPTAANKQPWEFLAINDRAIIESVAAAYGNNKRYQTASALIVVCGDTLQTLSGEAQNYWVQDCSAAAQNILLAAESIDLGALWTGVYPIAKNIERAKETFSLPENIIPLCIIAVGKPTGEDTPKVKWKAEKFHYNMW